jgi:membrane fusion protein (multidrug efflux system)
MEYPEMRRIVLLSVAGFAVIGAGIGGWLWWSAARYRESTDNAYVEADIAAVAPKIAGYIRTLAVVDNQRVRAGDVLAIIDERDFQARVAEATATVAAAEAANTSIDRQIDLQAARIEQAGATVDSAKAELARAQPEYERYKSMLADKVVGKSDFDRTAADFRKAEAELARAEAELLAEQGQLVVLRASRNEGDAKLAQAQAALQAAQIDLDNTVIRAPMDGVVGNKGVETGQYVQAGSLMMAIVPLPSVHIVANFKETQLENMRPGQVVSISVDAFPSTELTGTVESFAPASGAVFSLLPPENATGNFTKIVQRVPVRIAVPAGNPLAGLLRPGLSVEVSVNTRGAEPTDSVAGSIFGTAQAATMPAAGPQSTEQAR